MNDQNIIKVLLVDDHNVVRSGLAAFLMAYDDLDLVGEANNGKEAVEKVKELSPDVVLMDLVMPEMDGAETTERIMDIDPEVKVIALTSFKEKDLIERVLEAGAIGYLLKNVGADELAEAIRDAYDGKPTLAPEAAQALIQRTRKPKNQVEELTPRELEVLKLMGEGLTNPQIAEELVISNSTVKFHVSSILGKLNVDSRTEAVVYALKHNLIES
ncbi:MAG: response regulator transcription factor [Anaerolineales bacterium]|nr:response regulator transcription factor [Anaerolineales bacterium]